MVKNVQITVRKPGRPKKRPGRPTIMTQEVIGKLEEAWAIGATDEEACFYANISPKALYNYQERNPKILQRKAALKERPVLLARQKVVGDMQNNVETAKWYLERKKRGEFSVKVEQETNVNITFNNGVPRPKVIEGNATYSVPAKTGGNN